MPRRSYIDINIHESTEQLLEYLSQQTERWNYLKVKMLFLLKSGEATTLEQVAQILGIHQETPENWIKKYNDKGLEELVQPVRQIEVPNWAIERVVEELQAAHFFPSRQVIHAWLLTVGFQMGVDKAAEVRSIVRERLNSSRGRAHEESSSKLSQAPTPMMIEAEIYEKYHQWKQQCNFQSDRDALAQIMFEFFGLDASEQIDYPSDERERMSDNSSQALSAGREVPDFLTQIDLAKRLRVTNSILKNNRNKRTFTAWTKQKDPNKIGWKWVPNLRKYQSLLTTAH